MIMISKFNKRDICQKKIIILLRIKDMCQWIIIFTYISFIYCILILMICYHFIQNTFSSFRIQVHTPSKLKQPHLPLSLWDSFPFPPPTQNSNTSHVLPLSGKISHVIQQKQMLVIELPMTIIRPDNIYIYIYILICPHIK